ncbi:CoA transferase [Corynebacterium epidermidicanis]|uniref:CoA-transferase family III n=1 Tax=Corynebacterium epidermidicanis TaxID=1050174 RepID=A0A0G3GQY2_9CORY|nr:CoA transferase [Corynebacterium epidermidicanis]AKK01978.1 CoA-transferase family III [Corynebacterium epidermidicanis]
MEPLQNITVINLAVNLPGPWAADRLASLGARVVKLEPPAGDPLAHLAPTWYEELKRRCEIVTVDLKTPAGQAELNRLLADAHLLITSHRPSALTRMGVEVPEGVGHVEIVGDVDNPEHAGHDLTYQAEAGTLTPPHMPKVLLGDLMGASQAVSAALALLIAGGGHTRIGLKQAALDMAAPYLHGVTAPEGLLGGSVDNYRIYPAKDGFVAVAALEPHFAARLADHATSFPERSVAEIEKWARQVDLPISAVR